MILERVNSDELLRIAPTALRAGGPEELARRVCERWTPRQMCQLLHHDAAQVRKLTCVVLALAGDRAVQQCLTGALRDEDPEVRQLAEHALWSIWFRGGNAAASRRFRRGLKLMALDAPDEAIKWFRTACHLDPAFAEAYHQRAIAHYLLGEWLESIENCNRTLALDPMHFGALAGLGHCHAQLGNLAEAARFYRRALAINPQADGIGEALCRIEQCLTGV